jgi:L,D-peptidoglycan transpeptidase YkuD (ErfK/YbiS/YcfS/YnhG family)
LKWDDNSFWWIRIDKKPHYKNWEECPLNQAKTNLVYIDTPISLEELDFNKEDCW